MLDDHLRAVDFLVQGQLLFGQPPGLPVGVGAALGWLPYGGSGIVSGYALLSLVHVQNGAVRLGRIIFGHGSGEDPEVRWVLLEQREIVGAAGGRLTDPQYSFSGVGDDVCVEGECLLARIVRPAPVLVAGPVDAYVRAVQHDGDLPGGLVRGDYLFQVRQCVRFPDQPGHLGGGGQHLGEDIWTPLGTC